MDDAKVYDVAIIGGGIVGVATAMALLGSRPVSLTVLEAEDQLAQHQTGHNSGVIHSGLYYKPGSLKALNCNRGREQLYQFCQKHDIPHDRCGKIVVATREDELPNMDTLEQRGKANGLEGIKRLTAEQLKEYEPHVDGIAGLFVPQTGIVDYVKVTEKYAGIVKEKGGEIKLSHRVRRVVRDNQELVIQTGGGDIRCRNLINCAGLHSDRIAKKSGVKPGLRIVPFRGEYYELKPEAEHLVKNLIYPVPDPKFPFLGVHFTRMIQGGAEAGPNAVPAFKREGYTKLSFSLRDFISTFLYKGFMIMGMRNMKMGIGEMYRSWNKRAFVKALQRLIPEIRSKELVPGNAGVRAQALEPNGFLVDDFRIVQGERMIHVLNSPSPAATASISIGESIAQMAMKDFHL